MFICAVVPSPSYLMKDGFVYGILFSGPEDVTMSYLLLYVGLFL